MTESELFGIIADLRGRIMSLEASAELDRAFQIDDNQLVNHFIPEGGSSVFTGTAYIAGNKTTGLGTKAWVRCFLDTATAEDHDGPAPNPFPSNEEWYEVANTSGDIHIPRA